MEGRCQACGARCGERGGGAPASGHVGREVRGDGMVRYFGAPARHWPHLRPGLGWVGSGSARHASCRFWKPGVGWKAGSCGCGLAVAPLFWTHADGGGRAVCNMHGHGAVGLLGLRLAGWNCELGLVAFPNLGSPVLPLLFFGGILLLDAGR